MLSETATLEQTCINVVRGLAMDAVQKANSGHPGMPMGTAAMAHALWTRHLKYNPRNPNWFDRDRFVLSAGHGSMLLYSMLHLTGYDVSLDDLRSFRQWGSIAPGHPENHLTPGVEMATGPLGQGIATAVGMAIAERFLSATFNKPEHEIIDHRTYVIASDGDLMEGIAQEACSLAGHLGLSKLTVLYDDNRITIDGSTGLSFSDDTEGRFRSLGWHVLRADGLDPDDVSRRIEQARASNEPTIIICRTVIGYGSPNKSGSEKSHGAALGKEEVQLSKGALHLPEGEEFWTPKEVVDYYRQAVARGAEAEQGWEERFDAYAAGYPVEATRLRRLIAGELGDSWIHDLPHFETAEATRISSHKTLNAVAPHLPTLIGGCADLAESVKTHIFGGGEFQRETPSGRNVSYGVREHAMAAAVNGINLHGACRAYGGTFLIFSDYCRPSLRLAALMKVPSLFLFSHDSIGLGEDGPTHQPIEQAMSLRMIPNFNVMRPADGNETAACWRIALESRETPCAILLTRQSVPSVSPSVAKTELHPASKGAYVLKSPDAAPQVILVATGSEVSLALEAQEMLAGEGVAVSVVSMPSWFLFEAQSQSYKDSVLIPGVPVVSVEAGTTLGWSRYAQAHVGIDHFGASAPAEVLFREFGVTASAVAAAARALIS